MSNQGYVYILFNSAMPSLVKIGQTTRDPEDRAQEIGGTGVPGRFVVAYRERVPDCVAVERRIHRELAKYRYDPRREFFQLPLESAIVKMREIAEDERRRWIPKVVLDVHATVSVPASETPARPVPASETPARPVPASETPARPSGLPVVAARRPSWGLLSGLLLLGCVFGLLCTLITVIVSIEELAKSYAKGELVVGIFASIILVGMCSLVTELARRGAKGLRSKGW
jgi:hypothetical protein